MALDSQEIFETVDRLLDQALELTPAERGVLVEEARRKNPAVGARLDALLIAMQCEDGFLLRPVHEQAGRIVHTLLESGDIRPGAPRLPLERVGPYRLVREIGRGGMGAVFLAERDDAEFRMFVALKLLPRELGTEHAIRRFRDERRILASLTHPNIARLLDGGVEGGLPWYAMEYVDGTPIDRYCDEHRLPVEARLELFCQVCQAVQYAHRNLVVHRDLKPSNILVAEGATAKLLDFGIAQLTADATSGSPAVTLAPRMLTPEYASPEQLRGEAVSTAGDIYSLGVLLHELLTGRRPYDVPSRLPHEIVRVIVEEPQRSASAALALAGGEERVSVSRARCTSPERLSRRLRGDLDTVILMATRREPERRYGTVEQLAADVRRHLDGLPVSARPDTRGYRIRKFVRRHAVGVGTTAALALLLVGFSVVTVVQSRQVAEERDKAEQVAGFLASLFGATDPYSGGGAAITARQVLDSGAARITRQLAGQPALRAEMMAIMAQSYAGLGLYGESRQLIESSLEIQRRLHDDTHPDVVGTLTMLAQAVLGEGDYRTAGELYRRSLAGRRAIWGVDHPYVARTMNALAQTLRMLGSYVEAESLLREALAIDRRHLGEDGEDVAQSLRGLAHVLRDLGDHEDAEPFYAEAHALHRRRLGDDHPETANSLINLAVIKSARGDPATAEPMIRLGLAVKRRTFGDDHSDVATDMTSLAAVLHEVGKEGEAEALYRDAIAAHRAARPDGHPRTADALLGLGELLLDRNDQRGAEPLLREALAIRQRSLPAGHWHVAQAASVLGACLSQLGRSAEAGPLLVSGHETLQSVLGSRHNETRKAARRLSSGPHPSIRPR